MGLPAYLGEVPHYECDEAGRVHITMGDFALVMPPGVFLEGCRRGREAIAKWQVAQRCDNVVALANSFRMRD